jgi:ribosomal protein S27AE
MSDAIEMKVGDVVTYENGGEGRIVHVSPKRTFKPIARPNRVCPECGQTFKAGHGAQVFCCSAHQTRFHARNGQRGRMLLSLAQVWRSSKNGKTEENVFAFNQACALLDGWNAEDKEAGRQPIEIVRNRMREKWSAADAL